MKTILLCMCVLYSIYIYIKYMYNNNFVNVLAKYKFINEEIYNNIHELLLNYELTTNWSHKVYLKQEILNMFHSFIYSLDAKYMSDHIHDMNILDNYLTHKINNNRSSNHNFDINIKTHFDYPDHPTGYIKSNLTFNYII